VARRRLVLIDIAMASAAVVLLLAVAFVLIRTNLERSAYRNLEDVADAISKSDLHELFEEYEEHRSEFETEIISTSGSTSYWIVGLDGLVFQASTATSGATPSHLEDVDKAASGSVQKSVVESEAGAIRVVSFPLLTNDPPIVIQVSAPDSVGPELRPIISSLLITGAIGVVLAAIGGAFVARKTMRPVEQAFDLQRDFISGASHELRTPVAVIQANADAIQRLVPNLENDDSAILEDLQTESQFLGELVGRLSELARLQGDSQSQLERIDIGQLNEELARSMDVLVQNVGMKISVSAPSEPILASADRVMLRQVALSLIDNSIKYAGSGAAIELTANTHNGRCQLIIRDSGVGIEAEHLPHVTERFYRADKARSRKIGGSGLGLAIADEAVSRMGGSLDVSSAGESGTVVTISLASSTSGQS